MQETPQFDPWVGMIHWRRDTLPTPVFLGFSGDSAGKETACNKKKKKKKESTLNVGDLGSIPELGRFPGEWNSYPLQYYGLVRIPWPA